MRAGARPRRGCEEGVLCGFQRHGQGMPHGVYGAELAREPSYLAGYKKGKNQPSFLFKLMGFPLLPRLGSSFLCSPSSPFFPLLLGLWVAPRLPPASGRGQSAPSRRTASSSSFQCPIPGPRRWSVPGCEPAAHSPGGMASWPWHFSRLQGGHQEASGIRVSWHPSPC